MIAVAGSVTPIQHRVLEVLERWGIARKGAVCHPSQKRIAEELGVTERTVGAALRSLRKAGYIVVERVGRLATNLYRLGTRVTQIWIGSRGVGISPLRGENARVRTRGDAAPRRALPAFWRSRRPSHQPPPMRALRVPVEGYEDCFPTSYREVLVPA